MKTGIEEPLAVLTLGHSTRTWEAFVALLEHHGIRQTVDVRRHPGSRRMPQFARTHLEGALPARGIAYRWMEELGGWRKPLPETVSRNTGLRVAGFRAYADHMESEGFRRAVRHLLDLAAVCRTAVFCAEKLPETCHRRLLSDHLISLGVRVFHVLDAEHVRPHRPTEGVRFLAEGGVCYPPREMGEGPENEELFA